MSIEIVPTGAALGAEIRGVNLAEPIDDETFAAIERAYNDHGVIFFRDQHITPPQQVAFTHRFGEIEFNIFDRSRPAPGCRSPSPTLAARSSSSPRSTIRRRPVRSSPCRSNATIRSTMVGGNLGASKFPEPSRRGRLCLGQ